MDAQLQTALIQQALDANPQAIALLIRDRLEPTITVKAALKEGCLYLLLAGEQAPSARLALETVEPAIEDLAVAGLNRAVIQSVKVGGQALDERSPKWCYHIDLPPLPYGQSGDQETDPIVNFLESQVQSMANGVAALISDPPLAVLSDVAGPESQNGHGVAVASPEPAIDPEPAIAVGEDLDLVTDSDAALSDSALSDSGAAVAVDAIELPIEIPTDLLAEDATSRSTEEATEDFPEDATSSLTEDTTGDVVEDGNQSAATDLDRPDLDLIAPESIAPEVITPQEAPTPTLTLPIPTEAAQLQATLAALTGLASTLEKAAASLVTAVGSIAPSPLAAPELSAAELSAAELSAAESIAPAVEPVEIIESPPEPEPIAEPALAIVESPPEPAPELAPETEEPDFAVDGQDLGAIEALDSLPSEEPSELEPDALNLDPDALALTEAELADWAAIEEEGMAEPSSEAVAPESKPAIDSLPELETLVEPAIDSATLIDELASDAAIDEMIDETIDQVIDEAAELVAELAADSELLDPLADAAQETADLLESPDALGDDGVSLDSDREAAIDPIDLAEPATEPTEISPTPESEPESELIGTVLAAIAPDSGKTIAEKVTDAISSLVQLVEHHPNADVNTALAAIARLSALASPPPVAAPEPPPLDRSPEPSSEPSLEPLDQGEQAAIDSANLELPNSELLDSALVDPETQEPPDPEPIDQDLSDLQLDLTESDELNDSTDLTDAQDSDQLIALDQLPELPEIAELAQEETDPIGELDDELTSDELGDEFDESSDQLASELNVELADDALSDEFDDELDDELTVDEFGDELDDELTSDELTVDEFGDELNDELTSDELTVDEFGGELDDELTVGELSLLDEDLAGEDLTQPPASSDPEIAQPGTAETELVAEPTTISPREALSTIAQLTQLAEHRSDLDLNAAIATIARLAGFAPEPIAPPPEPPPATAVPTEATDSESAVVSESAAIVDELEESAELVELEDAESESLDWVEPEGAIDSSDLSDRSDDLSDLSDLADLSNLADLDSTTVEVTDPIEPAPPEVMADDLAEDDLAELADLAEEVEPDDLSDLTDLSDPIEPNNVDENVDENVGELADLAEGVESGDLDDLTDDLANFTESPEPVNSEPIEPLPDPIEPVQSSESSVVPDERSGLVNLVAQLLAESSDPRSALLALAESLGDGASAAPREPEPVPIVPAEPAELAQAAELAASTEPIAAAAITESVEANESPEFTESTEAADTEAADLEALPELVDFLDLSEEPEPNPAASTEPLPELPELVESLPEAPAAISFDSEPDLGPDSGQDDEPLSFFGDDDDEPSGFFGDEGFAALVDIANQALAAETADAAAAPAAVVDPEPAPVREPEPPLPVVEAAEPTPIAPPEPEPSAPPAPMDPLTQWLQQGDGSAILNLPTRSAGSALSTDGQRFLRFHLGFEDTALLPIDEVREVLRIAATDILPVPHMPESVLGVYNWRGEIIWTIDLNQLVGFPAIAPDLTATSSAIAIVLECDGQNLGLVVPQIEDIEWHDSPNVQPPSAGLFPDRLLPFVQGYLSEASSMVLNPSAIARASAQQAG
ncbi:MAG: hypothetical protein BJG00_012255 [Limnothrix sp. CACIAM 69d]|nr:MAG: hypothetical protein BJG00_012255 [Limnothrix sp. CACIAM 69d]